uniref:Hint domain-containing protein n=1 Tax=Nocardia suismassiliense TaxID=2077092 RepID=UPI00131EFFB6|nr:Hint domain-containing protein [Nocardia suismassiliense]
MVDDLESVRIANANRVRQLTRTATDKDGEERGFGLTVEHPEVSKLMLTVEALEAAEHDAVLNLRRAVRRHPLAPFQKRHKGIGEKQLARLLATIGDPYWNDLHQRPRTVSELWAYCVPRGERVSTPSGAIPIEDLKVGDRVFNMHGRPVEIQRVLTRDVNEEIISIRARKMLPLRLTSQHPVLVATFRNSRPGRWERTSLTWKPASEIVEGDYLVVPRLAEPAANTGDADEEMASLWGRFVGDGSTSFSAEGKYLRGRTTITFGHHESVEPWRTIARRLGGVYVGSTGTAQQMQIGRTTVAMQFREMFGHDAANKRICPQIMLGDSVTAKAFLRGYLTADGHVTGIGRTLANSVSIGLVLQLQLLSTRLGTLPSVREDRPASQSTIQGRTVSLRTRYGAQWSASESADLAESPSAVTAKSKYRRDDDFFYVEVKSVEREQYSGTVFDLTTDGSFLVNNLVVHNCGFHVLKSSGSQDSTETQRCRAAGTQPHAGNQSSAGTQPGLVSGVAPKRQRGQRSNWSENARKRVWVIASAMPKFPGGHYEATYRAARMKYADATHRVDCVRCGPAGTPAPAGSSLSDGHKHARAVRIVAKEILKDLWIEARAEHSNRTTIP